jgi:hypothetical protein
MSADKGKAKAQYNLAAMFRKGQGTIRETVSLLIVFVVMIVNFFFLLFLLFLLSFFFFLPAF